MQVIELVVFYLLLPLTIRTGERGISVPSGPVISSSVLRYVFRFSPFCSHVVSRCGTSLCVGKGMGMRGHGRLVHCMPSVFHFRGRVGSCLVRSLDRLRCATPSVCSHGVGTMSAAFPHGEKRVASIVSCLGVGVCSSSLVSSGLLSPLSGGSDECCRCLLSSVTNPPSYRQCGVLVVPGFHNARLIDKCV